ncbi:hypothetical protein NDU88_002940 [Pleurodeles waltl]|uniref:Gag protein n=1 Tax=Pleurodeles waltl TaxID=8319 RepID=A0AAV7MS05_PLEWA|nr:hypothetical protein NDU88_002940 [Pleurodeles waltl]
MADDPAPAAHPPPQHSMVGALPPFSQLADPATASPKWKLWVAEAGLPKVQASPGTSKRGEGESIDQFYVWLQEPASTCTEDDQPKEIRAQIIQGCKNKMLRGLILSQPNISLDEILIMAQSHELSAARAAEMDIAMAQTPEKAPTVKTECVDAVQMQRTKKNTPP